MRQWAFAPSLVDGQTSLVVTTIAVRFALPLESAPAPALTLVASPSGMPPDFAIVYREPCKNQLRHVLTRSTHDLEGVYRALSTAGLLSRSAGQISWQDLSFIARTTEFDDRIEVVVPASPDFFCVRGVHSRDAVQIAAAGPADTYADVYSLAVRADGTWTQLWPPELRNLQTPENEQRLSTVRQLIQKTIAERP